MLVLSRRVNEKILFSNIGVKVQILRVQGNVVRVGIEAPPSIQILREELQPHSPPMPLLDLNGRPKITAEMHASLDKIESSLKLLKQQWANGDQNRSEAILDKVLAELQALDHDDSSAKAVPAKTPIRPLRTLVVDDDANERELLAGLLNMNGYECAAAGDGVEAIDYLSTHERPDVMLLDMLMPRCNGAETVNRVRQDKRFDGLKIIAISGSSQRDMGLETGPHGVDAWFAKPIDPQKLFDALRSSRQN